MVEESYHLLDCVLVVVAEIDRSVVCFPEGIAASAVEKAAPRAEDSAVDVPLSVIACDCEV